MLSSAHFLVLPLKTVKFVGPINRFRSLRGVSVNSPVEVAGFHGLQDDEAQTVSPRVDKLLWNCRVLPSYPRNRRVDLPQGSHVLLETVVLCQNQSAESPETRYW